VIDLSRRNSPPADRRLIHHAKTAFDNNSVRSDRWRKIFVVFENYESFNSDTTPIVIGIQMRNKNDGIIPLNFFLDWHAI